jgi:hypothetical protein
MIIRGMRNTQRSLGSPPRAGVSLESEKEEGRGNVIISQQKSVIDQERGQRHSKR